MTDGASEPRYPWYFVGVGDDLQQGDMFFDYPVFLPVAGTESENTIEAEMETRDLIVMTQSCDLVKGQENVDEVHLCAVWKPEELRGKSGKALDLEAIKKGRQPAYHLLNKSELPGFERDISVVDFKRVYSLPLAYLRKKAHEQGTHLRLMPPYREHLAQAFARSYMRVGLPADIELPSKPKTTSSGQAAKKVPPEGLAQSEQDTLPKNSQRISPDADY